MKLNAFITKEQGGGFSLEPVEFNEPKENEVLVRIYASSICHTDEYVRSMGMGTQFPAILGHEGTGIVEKIGSKVTLVKPGDHVALTIPHCGECEFCKRGEYTRCENIFGLVVGRDHARDMEGNRLDTLMMQGSFAEYAMVYETSCVVIDEDIPFDIAAPVGCGFGTGAGTVLNYLKPTRHDTIAIFGCGATGFASLCAAKIAGCRTIIAVGRSDEKLALAKECGATHVINSKRLQEEKGYSVELTGFVAGATCSYPLVDEIMAMTEGKGVDYAVVTAPVQEVITPAIFALARGGECCISAALDEIVVPLQHLQNKNLKVSSCGMGAANKYEFFPYLLKCYRDGLFPIDKLITHYKFEDIQQALDDMNDGKVIKPVLQW